MSRAYREQLERQYPILRQYREHGQEQQQAEVGREEWYGEQDALAEYNSWLDTLGEQQ